MFILTQARQNQNKQFQFNLRLMQNPPNSPIFNTHAPQNWPANDARNLVTNAAECIYLSEALRVAAEGVCDLQTIDLVLREHGGFSQGPFELADGRGLRAVAEQLKTTYHAWGEDPRLRVSPLMEAYVQRDKAGSAASSGFYSSGNGRPQAHAAPARLHAEPIPPVWLSPRAARRAETLMLFKNLGVKIETGQSPSPQALTIVSPLGFDVTTVAVVERLDPARTVGFDTLFNDSVCLRRVIATNPVTRSDMKEAAYALFQQDEKPVSVVNDSAGFISQRVWAQLINIATELCQQGHSHPDEVDAWMAEALGLKNGPLSIGNDLGPTNVLEVLFNMQTVYADPCYRPSPWLRRRGAIGLSLLQISG